MSGSAADVRKTYAYETLVKWAKYEYKQLLRGMSQQAQRAHNFTQWAEKWLKRKHDISFSLHEPRDLSHRDEVVAKAMDELTEWKSIGKLDVTK